MFARRDAAARYLVPSKANQVEPVISATNESYQATMSSELTKTSAPVTSSTNVLVVEDEMVLRLRAVDIVEDAGFTAVEAVSADEALAILESRSDISLLFSDIQMPGSMDGLMLARAVHERWPAIKIILA